MRSTAVIVALIVSGSIQAAGTTKIEIKQPSEQAIPGNNNEVWVIVEVVMELSSDEKGFGGAGITARHIPKLNITGAREYDITPVHTVTFNVPEKGKGPTTSKFRFKTDKGSKVRIKADMEYEKPASTGYVQTDPITYTTKE